MLDVHARVGNRRRQTVAPDLEGEAWKLSLNGIGKLLDELHGLLVSMRLRERRRARDVREQEGGSGLA